jgi:hypothetical protein
MANHVSYRVYVGLPRSGSCCSPGFPLWGWADDSAQPPFPTRLYIMSNEFSN